MGQVAVSAWTAGAPKKRATSVFFILRPVGRQVCSTAHGASRQCRGVRMQFGTYQLIPPAAAHAYSLLEFDLISLCCPSRALLCFRAPGAACGRGGGHLRSVVPAARGMQERLWAWTLIQHAGTFGANKSRPRICFPLSLWRECERESPFMPPNAWPTVDNFFLPARAGVSLHCECMDRQAAHMAHRLLALL